MKGLNLIKAFFHQVARIQCDAVWWFIEVVPKRFKLAQNMMSWYVRGLHKILFVVKEDEYCCDGWPAENDR